MGQKTNPNIFRLGKTKTWNFKYYEKKTYEAGLYAFRNLELEKFIYKFFNDNGLIVANCKIHSSENLTHIFVTYYNSSKFITLLNDINKDQKIKFISKSEDLNYRSKRKFKKKYFFLRQNSKNFLLYNILKYKKLLKKNKAEHSINKNRIQRLKLLNYYKIFQNIKQHKNNKQITLNQYFEKFFNTLIFFTQKKGKFIMTLNQINKNTKSLITNDNLKSLKKNLIQLRKYKSNDFFKDSVNLLFSYVTKTPFSELLSQYLANELGQQKRHNFFLRFISTTLKLFIKNTSSKIEAIKIIIKGRLNSTPRARHKIITIGTGVPNLTINLNIDYSESVAFTPNGTLGVKVWTFKK